MTDENAISQRDIDLLKEKHTNSDDFKTALERLKNREPLAYIIGEWYFYNETYKVSPDCLVPRPETEHLVEELIKKLPQNGRFADLCTGSGCIAISTLVHRPDTAAVAVDISSKALSLARENAVMNEVSDRISFINGDILSFNLLDDDKFDIIVSNPPYIRTDIIPALAPEVLSEPIIALDGGTDGLDFYRALIKRYIKNIRDGGYLICEIGYDQGESLKAICDCIIKKDYSGNDRIMILKVNRERPI